MGDCGNMDEHMTLGSEYSKLWGSEGDCHNYDLHPCEGLGAMTLDEMRWIRLGVDTVPRSCTEWIPDHLKAQKPARTWFTKWRTFEAVMGGLSEGSYVLKVPGISDAMLVCNARTWGNALRTLRLEMGNNENYWCPARPPVVVVVATPDLGAKWDQLGWYNCVAIEAEDSKARATKPPKGAAEDATAGKVDKTDNEDPSPGVDGAI
ncbi:hypothetical protein HIM_08652 [Hirsutella minnesotensis 3608]|uniref:Uncharacterized protein n=1 Tax=Hirsutella minnesotensis 3608 TaxID=1043627 RepID=A0A0F7ZY73_9HYPO|nr:hypothetical protein HIM_08652 [Hirsutella minnesotensis 3608]